MSGKSLLFSVAIVPCVAWSALFIPQTSQLTMQNEPLAKGEAAYVESSTPGYAQLVVGGDNGKTLRVEDAATVHGYEYEYIPRTKVTIIPSSGITYNGATDKYTAATATGTYTLTVMVPPDYVIDTLEYVEVAYYSDMIELPNGTISHVINGNIAVVTMDRTDTRGEMSVANVKIRRVLAGNVDTVNDLTKLEFLLRDDLGEYNWRYLREWVAHLYDGNRGSDWTRYKATSRIRLDSQEVSFSSNNRFGLHTSTNEVVLRAANHAAIVVRATGTGSGYEGAFQLGRPTPTAEGVDIPFHCDITDFDASKLAVSGGVSLVMSEWSAQSFSYDVGSSTLHVAAGAPANMRFYQVYYSGELIDSAAVEVNVPLRVMDSLYLKGDDDQIYRIKVTGGVLSAELAN